MTKTLSLPFAALALGLGLAGCKHEVDPVYLQEIESAADAMCACAQAPKPERCDKRNEKKLHPETGPNGGPSAAYEASLNEKSQEKLAAARARADACWADEGKGGKGPHKGGHGGGGANDNGGGNGGGNGGNGGGGNGGNGGGGNGGNAPAPAGSY